MQYSLQLTEIMIKKSLLLLFTLSLFSFSGTRAASDSLDVVRYNIFVDSLAYGQRVIHAHTIVTFTPGYNNYSVATFDLLRLTVDSVIQNGNAIPFTHNDTLLRVNLASVLNLNDTATLAIWYHGNPATDLSGFGGYYFSDTSFAAYVYNIGVGFDADPHSYGRVWFPCNDIFTDKALAEVHLRVKDGQTSVAGGSLISIVSNGDGTNTQHWVLRDPVPSYLVSMAVSVYIIMVDSFVSITNDTLPIQLFVKSVDSLDAVVLFANLKNAIAGFENRFGPMRWERVGYVSVPFNAGAMEHATNVAYPVAYLNGTLQGETTMAHELAHSWFGNLVTCDKQEEMWLNEGFAAYCEAVFTEWVYGQTAFKDYVRANQAEVLRKAHVTEGGFLPVSGIGHSRTYGTTVYKKGSMVAHSLRGHMGDSLFFGGLRNYFNSRAFGNANSDSLRVSLEAVSGTNLAPFFDAWVYEPGFIHYAVDSFTAIPAGGGNYTVSVHVKQRLRATSVLCGLNNLQIKFLGQNWLNDTRIIYFNGATGSATFTLPFLPVAVLADPEQRYADASVEYPQILHVTGSTGVPWTYVTLDVDSIADSAFVNVIHNWVAPDSFQNAQSAFVLNDTRYWKIEGIFPAGFKSRATFIYNGTVSSSSAQAYLDNTWLDVREDSLVLLYRSGPGQDWAEAVNYTVNTGSLNDKKGTITLSILIPGEYALGKKNRNFVGRENPDTDKYLQVFPNPAFTSTRIKLTRDKIESVEIWTSTGVMYSRFEIQNQAREVEINLNDLAKGNYFVRVNGSSGTSYTRKLILN